MRLTSTGTYARPQPVPKMPAGLVELMEDLTRNVLRHNPADVYEFCAGHMEKLLEIRDGRALKTLLTLEQKIARVQEKMNKKAELRRQKYDKQMQTYYSNSTLVQTSEQQDDKMGLLNAVEDKLTDSPEIDSNPTEDNSKQTVTSILEENQIPNAKICENETKESIDIKPDQEFNTTNNYEKELKTKEFGNTKLDQDIDTNITVEAESKELIELSCDIQNKSEEPIISRIMDIKSVPCEEQNEPKNVTLEYPEQDFQTDNNLEESTSSYNLDGNFILNAAQNESSLFRNNESNKNITAELVADNLLEDDKKDLKNLAETSSQAVIETITKSIEFIEDYVIQDKTAITNTLDDDSKGPVPVHHEQDLVNALEVEIFHELKESNKGSKKETINTQGFEDTSNNHTNFRSDLKNKTGKDNINEEGQYSVKKYNSFDHHDLPSSRKEEETLPKTSNLKSFSVDDHFLVSKPNSFECTKTNVMSSEIKVGDNMPKCNISENSGIIVAAQVNTSDVESDINDLSGTTLEDKLNNEFFVSSVVDQKELNNEENIIAEKMPQSADKRVQEISENIPYNIQPEDMKETIQDAKDESPSDIGICEIPMQKKEYALLLPETSADDNMKLTTLKNDMNKENVTTENQNVPTKTDRSAGIIMEAELVQTSDINQVTDSSVSFVQDTKDMDENQEKSENSVDNIENELIENAAGHITQNNLNSHINGITEEQKSEIKKQQLEKVSYNKQNEIITKNNDIKIGSQSINMEENSGDAEENMLNNSELTQKTETPIDNDSAGESTIGDSNESLMDQDVEMLTRSRENNTIPSTMDLETAAVTIQKVFRTFLFKSRCSTFEDTSTDEANPITDDDNEKEELEYPLTKERRTLGISRMDTVLQTVNEEKSLSLSTDDSSTLSSAATVIQAHVRGFLARNKFNSYKTTSNASLVNSDGPSTQSFEADEQQKKTVLNIHIVPERDNFLSRDESLITSMDLSLDGTPPSSVNLHPLGYDKSEPRKQLKREDAIQSVSPPSNNSGKLSEDVDSVKEMVINELADPPNVFRADTDMDNGSSTTKSNTLETVVEIIKGVEESSVPLDPEIEDADLQSKRTLTKMSSDEGDVVTPFEQDRRNSINSDRTSCLLHSGEFHDILLPTKVTRSDASVVREFKNVLVYFLIWNA